jgi:hypothetical protein
MQAGPSHTTSPRFVAAKYPIMMESLSMGSFRHNVKALAAAGWTPIQFEGLSPSPAVPC